VDINHSTWDNLLEQHNGKYCAIRLGFRQVKGLREEDMQVLVTGRKNSFACIRELLNLGLSKATLEKLADADAFRSIGLDRRRALWEISACNDQPVGIFKGQTSADPAEEKVILPHMSEAEHVIRDYKAISLSLKAHPVSFVREKLELLHIVPTQQLSVMHDGDKVKVAGLVTIRQRPGTAEGVCFVTIEDETGIANLVVFPNIFETFRKELLQASLFMAEGKLQVEGEVIHVIVQRCYDLSPLIQNLTATKEKSSRLMPLSRADESISSANAVAKRKQKITREESLFPRGRNFR